MGYPFAVEGSRFVRGFTAKPQPHSSVLQRGLICSVTVVNGRAEWLYLPLMTVGRPDLRRIGESGERGAENDCAPSSARFSNRLRDATRRRSRGAWGHGDVCGTKRFTARQ